MTPHHEINFNSLALRDLKATYVFTCYNAWQLNGRRELILTKEMVSFRGAKSLLSLYFSVKE